VEAGKLELENIEFELEDILESVSDIISDKAAQEKGIELIYEFDNSIPVNLKGDPLRINQILNNLVSNSLKFTEKGEIVISVYKIDENDEKMIVGFSVKDTGVGIPKSKLDTLFQSFQQADTSITRKYGGTGLGLTIVKNLITLMNGEISVESELNVGTTFKFTIELERSENEKNRVEKNLKVLKDLKILVCDDNETFRTIIKSTLQSFCFKVETVESGFDAINELIINNHDPYDLVLMDWNMPELDGIEASKFIKNNKSISKIPIIIMVSAYTKDDLIESAEQAGIDSFIVKPINHSTLFDSIMSVMGFYDIISTYEERNSNVYDKTNLLHDKRILLVEDNEINQMVANDLLKNHGVIVEIADNGLKAIEKIKENAANYYDIVLMDLHMPVMDGYTAT
ncbi:MAG: response regulator, partial [Candidatus Kapaibacterium sp.]